MKRLLQHPFVRKHISQGLKFVLCGGCGMIVDLTSLHIFVHYLSVEPKYAVVFSSMLGALFVFFANKFFTFKNREKKYGSQFFKFALVYGTAIASNVAISWLLLYFGLHYLLAKFIAIGIGALWNYTLSHSFIFRKGEEVDAAIV